MGKKEVQLKTKRLMILPMTDEELENLIRMTDSPELKQAYQEMLDGCRQNQEQRIWYTAWKICLKENKKEIGKQIGDIGFKGPVEHYSVEIGYGIDAEYEGNGYATEAAKAMIDWAMYQENVYFVEAEVASDNMASRRVLEKKETGSFLRRKALHGWQSICFLDSVSDFLLEICQEIQRRECVLEWESDYVSELQWMLPLKNSGNRYEKSGNQKETYKERLEKIKEWKAGVRWLK